jgi:hypothetical protein
MMGCYDFCGHYEWTFDWLEQAGGKPLLRAFWEEGISKDSQLHARELIARRGFEGMKEYWGHTLAEESPGLGFALTHVPGVFRIDISDCPSKGFLVRNGLKQYSDYCDHCIGWIGPMMRDAGFVVDHEHNHCGQCWWEMRSVAAERASLAAGAIGENKDVRLAPNWLPAEGTIDRYERATSSEDKTPPPLG